MFYFLCFFFFYRNNERFGIISDIQHCETEEKESKLQIGWLLRCDLGLYPEQKKKSCSVRPSKKNFFLYTNKLFGGVFPFISFN